MSATEELRQYLESFVLPVEWLRKLDGPLDHIDSYVQNLEGQLRAEQERWKRLRDGSWHTEPDPTQVVTVGWVVKRGGMYYRTANGFQAGQKEAWLARRKWQAETVAMERSGRVVALTRRVRSRP